MKWIDEVVEFVISAFDLVILWVRGKKRKKDKDLRDKDIKDTYRKSDEIHEKVKTGNVDQINRDLWGESSESSPTTLPPISGNDVSDVNEKFGWKR